MRLLGGLYGNGWLAWLRARLIPLGKSDQYAKLLLKYDDAYSTCFEDHLHGTKNGVACYERHNQAVLQHAKAQGREVLVYNVKQGWKPLCESLGLAEPVKPFPRLNDMGYFQSGTTKIHAAVLVGIFLCLFKFAVPVGAAALAVWYGRRWVS